MLKSYVTAAMLALALPAVADAAPFWSVTGGTNYALPNLGPDVRSFNPNVANSATGLNELIAPFALEGIIPNPVINVGGALNLIQNAASLTFTFFGREAGANNAAFEAGPGILNTGNAVGDTFVSGPRAAASPLAFKFTSTFGGGTSVVNGGAALGAQIAFLLSPFNDSVVWAFFDDGGGPSVYKCATGDCDFDDMIVRVQAAAVPLPAAGLLLLGGLVTIGAVARRRKGPAGA